MEDTQRIETQLFQCVCDVLDRAGFRMRDGGRGLAIVATPQGVRVSWRPGHTPVHPAVNLGTAGRNDTAISYGRGIRAAMATAVASVLEQAGYRVYAGEEDLLVTRIHQHPDPKALIPGEDDPPLPYTGGRMS